MPKLSKIKYGEIDEALRPLIKELNKVGIKTKACCSGHNGRVAYIAIDFKSLKEISANEESVCLHWQYK